MTFDEVASLSVQPVLGPPGPRILALLALALVGALASLSRAAVHGLLLVRHPRPQATPVEVPRPRVRSRHEV